MSFAEEFLIPPITCRALNCDFKILKSASISHFVALPSRNFDEHQTIRLTFRLAHLATFLISLKRCPSPALTQNIPPPTTFSPHCFVTDVRGPMPLDTLSTYSQTLLRQDGRRWNELRRVTASISTQPSSDGSSLLTLGNTMVLCTVTGPREGCVSTAYNTPHCQSLFDVQHT